MSDEKAIYWLTQIVGWFLFVLLIFFQNLLTRTVDVGIFGFLAVNFVLGIGLSHLMRYIIVRLKMLKMRVYQVLIGILFLSVTTGFLASMLVLVYQYFIYNYSFQDFSLTPMVLIELLIPFTMVFLIWNVLYVGAIYLKNYEREEIKNLRLSAAVTEVELQNLRSQLNPHFMFNALNSIRALIDENPRQAKKSITKMSHLLRMGLSGTKKSFITIADEIKLVKDYLDLEKIRYEERLEYRFCIPEHLNNVLIPPLLIQTLVENAIKHGISKLPQGGCVYISLHEKEREILELIVENTGVYRPEKKSSSSHSGIGIQNSKRRLNLIFGSAAALNITNLNDRVMCTVVFPKKINNNENTYY